MMGGTEEKEATATQPTTNWLRNLSGETRSAVDVTNSSMFVVMRTLLQDAK